MRAYDTRVKRKAAATCILCGADMSAEIPWPLVKGQNMETKTHFNLNNQHHMLTWKNLTVPVDLCFCSCELFLDT